VETGFYSMASVLRSLRASFWTTNLKNPPVRSAYVARCATKTESHPSKLVHWGASNMGQVRHYRGLRTTRLILVAILLCASAPAQPDQVHISPVGLVRNTVRNELKADKDSGHFMFRSRKQTSSGSQTKLFVQTRDATAGMLIAINDQPLNPQQRQDEEGRLQYLIKNPDELKRKRKQERDDAERTSRIMRALPDAFLYEYDGMEKGNAALGSEGAELVRLKFRPNPKYDPPSRVEQVLTGMQGIVLIDPKENRIARMDGTLFKDVGFGWGILGHLDKGGHFLVQQAKIGDDTWAITKMQLSFTGKAFFFKNIAFKHEEVFSEFRKVSSNLSFAEGVALLHKQGPVGEENQNGSKGS
jgi:hypothetical protein